MTRVLIAVAIVAVAAGVAWFVRQRRVPDAPTQRRYSAPEQLDRADFVRPDAPWLVAVFTSDSCDKCGEVAGKAAVLESDEVAVTNVEFTADRELHARYQIDAVPTLVIVDARGVTRRSFLGPMSATDLWAAVAEARDPGSTPDACADHTV
ncbi:thioredoxin domain-containing protein [Ilumatobacter nonamiensis]|uniref:thioredoxin domain-containing protein n=1 Tax=Ilumatobacter nonamiensis TaxID=467093 RepID=UPI000345BDD0|nr:thioredoxin domain-containing protein [Ilumatobacter nonamiensis]